MVQRFDAAISDDDEIEDDTRAAWDTLCWVVDEGRSDSLVTDYFPEEQ